MVRGAPCFKHKHVADLSLRLVSTCSLLPLYLRTPHPAGHRANVVDMLSVFSLRRARCFKMFLCHSYALASVLRLNVCVALVVDTTHGPSL